MTELSRRLAGLSPERRKLIERLLEKENLQLPPDLIVSQREKPLVGGEGDQSLTHHGTYSDKKKSEISRFYNTVSQQLDTSMFGKDSYFLNLGYVANENPQYSTIELPEHVFDKNSVKLILETIGDFDITGSRVLDVGCGRGGTIFVIKKHFAIKTAVGVDLSSAAISFCHDHHSDGNARFTCADAENLPFEDGSFDVVTNIESSHSYPNIFFFYTEVLRVLKAGGYFLYTDYFPDANRVAVCLDFLRDQNFMVERDQDISRNVLSSCDEIATKRLQAFDANNNDEVMINFLGAPGSLLYDGMQTGKSTFRILRLRKT